MTVPCIRMFSASPPLTQLSVIASSRRTTANAAAKFLQSFDVSGFCGSDHPHCYIDTNGALSSRFDKKIISETRQRRAALRVVKISLNGQHGMVTCQLHKIMRKTAEFTSFKFRPSMSQAITCCTDVICGSSPHAQLLPTAAILTRFHCHSDRCHCSTESAWVTAAFVVDGRRVTISTRVGGCIRFFLCSFDMNNQLIRMPHAKHILNVMHF